MIVIREERASEQGVFLGIGELISRHDRSGQNTDRAVCAVLEAPLAAHRVRELVSGNNVHLQYYDWSCTDHCDLPDPLQPKLFDWVPVDSETVRLDPDNYYTSRTHNPRPQGGNMQVEIEGHYPVTIAMVDPPTWTDATERPSAARNLDNIIYLCAQQHVPSSM